MTDRQIVLEETDDTRELWKLARKFFLTASDFANFGRLVPSYYPDRRPEILGDKLHGRDREFDETSQRRMAHGRENEDHNREKFSRYAKLRTKPSHFFMTNPRWPNLGVTLDGLVARPSDRLEIDPLIFTQPDHVQRVRDDLLFLETAVGICELKQHDGSAYQRRDYFGHTKRNGHHIPAHVPVSIVPQVQGQMWIADFKWALVVSQLGASDMQVHLLRRDPNFARVLDDLNDKFQRVVMQHRHQVWG